MIYGWAGADLEIELSRGNIQKKEGSYESYEAYLGAKGTNAKILWDRVPPEVAPFSPENLLIVGAGVLDGTIVPFANRTAITFKSPVTGLLGYSMLGGHFGPELKHAGYNTIVISGKSPAPVYLWVEDDTVELRDASHLWGKDTQETQRMLLEELNEENAQILCIGPAGENKVYAASIEHSIGISASRRGVGTIMGDKKLKAIAVHGTKDVFNAQPGPLYQLCREILGRTGWLLDAWDSFPFLDATYHLPMGAYGNFREDPQPEVWEALKRQNEIGEACKPLKVRRLGCSNCGMRCRQIQRASDGRLVGLKCSAHTRSMIATEVFDGRANMEFVNLCEKYGLDALAVQNVVAFVIDLYEKGILTKKDTDGMHLQFGNIDVALTLIRKMVYREGIGDIMANGTYRAARLIGRGAEEYAFTTKKLECRHDFLCNPADALGEAISDGADHHKLHTEIPTPPYDKYDWSPEAEDKYMRSEFWGHPRELEEHFRNRKNGFNYEGMCQWTCYADESAAVHDSLGLCAWCAGWLDHPPITGMAMFAHLLSLVAGMDIDEAGLRKTAQRIQCLVRSYNVREGLRRDAVLELFLKMKPPEYVKQIYGEVGQLDPDLFNRWIDRYYELKGWDREGIPTKETLEKLDLRYVHHELERRGISATPV
jgi:aldehyde:ferredoxin oxidoreductase